MGLVEMYESGVPYKEMAHQLGLSVPGVQTRLVRLGVPAHRRPRLGGKLIAALLDEMRAAHETKTCITHLAKRCGVSTATLRRLEAQHGVPLYRNQRK